jgi:uncharacterized repeat protein (TIGR03803 family)
MSRAFLLQSFVFSVSLSLVAACAGSGGSTSGPLPQTGALAVGAAQRSASSVALKPSKSKYTSLYSFKGGTDGIGPWAGLVAVNGVFYGTTVSGGTNNSGTVFAMSASGTESVLNSFGGGYGTYPDAALIAVNGFLYGTTDAGGTPSNRGVVFALSTSSGTESVLHGFEGGADGSYPDAALIDVKGTLYGTTTRGGASNLGTVFAVSTSGFEPTESVLHSFGGGADGSSPGNGSLIAVNGVLYGTTAGGGVNNDGTVFAMSTSGTEKILHSFGSGTDGSSPEAGLIDVNGTLYGTTSRGGGASNGGTVFSVSTSGKESVLHSFGGGADGLIPGNGSLIAVKGVLYGTTVLGGVRGGGGDGTVFAMSRSSTETILHSFGGGADGSAPQGGLIDVNGTLYGTTYYGGASGFGTVFRVSL